MGYNSADLKGMGMWDSLDEPTRQQILSEERPAQVEAKPEAPGIGTRALGLLQSGWAKNIELVYDINRSLVKASQLGKWSEQDQASWQQAKTEAAGQFHNMEAAKAVAAHPATSVPGQLLSGLVEFAPSMGTYTAAEMLGGPLLAAGARATKLKPLIKASEFLAGKTGGEGLVAGTARTVSRAGLTGAGVGALAAEEGQTLSRAAEEGAGFAAAAGAFHLGLKGLGYGLKKAKGALTERQPQVGELRGMKSKSEADPSWAFRQEGEQPEAFDNWKGARTKLRKLQEEGETDWFVAKDKTYGKYYLAKEVAKHPVATPEDLKEGGSIDGAAYPDEIKVKEGVPVREPAEAELKRPKSLGEVTPDEWAAKYRKPVDVYSSERERVALELLTKYDNETTAEALMIMDTKAKAMGLEPEAFYKDKGWQAFDMDVTSREGKPVTGVTDRKAGLTITQLFKEADRSTLVHEMWHQFELDMPAAMKAKMDDIIAKNPSLVQALYDKGIARADEEVFAYSFEDWLRTGKAPNNDPLLLQAFRQFKDWLVELYKGFKVLKTGVHPEIDAFFKEQFKVTPQQITQAKVAKVKAAKAAPATKAPKPAKAKAPKPAAKKAKPAAPRDAAEVVDEKAAEEEGVLQIVNKPSAEQAKSVEDAQRALNTLNMLERNSKRGDSQQRQAAQAELEDFQQKLQSRGLTREALEQKASAKEVSPPEEPTGTVEDVSFFGEQAKAEEKFDAEKYFAEGKYTEVRAVEDYQPIPETFTDELFVLTAKDNKSATLSYKKGDQLVETKVPIADYNRYFREEEGLFQTVFHGGPEDLAKTGVKPITEAERKGTGGAVEGAGFYVTEQHKAGEYYAKDAKAAATKGDLIRSQDYQVQKSINKLYEFDRKTGNYALTSKMLMVYEGEYNLKAAFNEARNTLAHELDYLEREREQAIAFNFDVDKLVPRYDTQIKMRQEALKELSIVEDNIDKVNFRSQPAYLHKINLPVEKMNWLEWDKPPTYAQAKAIYNRLQAYKNEPPTKILTDVAFEDLYGRDAKWAYRTLEHQLGSKEAASKFLSEIGIDGMKYRGQSASGERYKGDYFNYVVYDPPKWLQPEAFEMTGLYQQKMKGPEPIFEQAERIRKDGLEDTEWKDYIASVEQSVMKGEPVSLETLRLTKDYSDFLNQTFSDKQAAKAAGLKVEMEKLGRPEREAVQQMEEFAKSESAQESYRIAKLAATKAKDMPPEDLAQVETLLQRVKTYTPMLDRLSTAAEHPDFGKVVNLGGELKPLTGLAERATPGEMLADLKLASDAFTHMMRENPKALLENPAKAAGLFDKFNKIYEAVAKFDERIESAQMSWIYDPKMASRRWLKGAWAVAADDMFSKNNPAMFHLMTKINGMHWMAKKFPVLQPMYELQWKRLEDATILAGDIMKGAGPEMNFEYGGKQLSLDGFWPLFSLREKDPQAYEWVAKLLWKGDEQKRQYTRDDLVDLTIRGLGQRREDVIAAYQSVRNTQDWIFHNTLRYLTAGVTDTAKLQQLEKDLAQRMNYHPGYLPHTREGKWVLAVFDGNKSTESVHMERVRNHIDATRGQKRLQEQYPGMNVKLMPAREAARIGLTAKQELMGLVEDLTRNAGTEEQVADQLRNAALQMLKEKGYWTHFKERKDIPGFDLRLGRVLYQQAQEYAGFISKMDFAKAGWQELAKLRKGQLNELHNYGRDWFDLMLKQSDATDQFMGRLRSGLFLKYLGLNFKSSLVTTVEKITNVPYFLGFYTKEPHKYNMRATADIVDWVKWTREAGKFIEENRQTDYKYNWRQALNDVPLPKGIKAEEAEMLRELFHKGATRAQFMQEVAAQSEARWEIPSDIKSFEKAQDFIDKMGNKSMKVGTFLIGKMEQWGRESTALAAFRVFRDKGYDTVKATRMAERLVLDSHFMYGKANQPLWLNKGGINRLAKLALTFRTQEWNYLSMIGHLMGMPGKEGKLAAAKSLLTLAALGGGTALPFFAGANKVLGMTTGVEPAEAIRKKLDNMTDSEYMGNLFGEGLPSMLGISLTGSLRVGGDFTMKEIMGGAFGSALGDLKQAASAAKEGDFMTFAEKFLPMAASNPVKAYDRYKNGVMTGRGNPVTMAPGEDILKLHGYEALGHVLGFQPQRVTRAMEKQGARIRSDEYWRGQRTKIYTSLKKGILRGDQEAINRAFEKVAEFNMSLPAHVSPITSQSIKQSLSQRPRLRQMLQEQELFGTTP